MTTTKTLTRRFRFGVTTLADPDPSAAPLDALRMHATAYTFLASATLGEPVVEGDCLVYPVQKPAVQTKGARKARAPKGDTNLDDILAWGQSAQTVDDSASKRWSGVSSLVNDRAGSDSNALIDSFLIPMA